MYYFISATRVALCKMEDTIFFDQLLIAALNIAVQRYKLMCSKKIVARTKTKVPRQVSMIAVISGRDA